MPIAREKFTVNPKDPHQVYLNSRGEQVVGVTTVLAVLAKPALIHWAWSEGKAGRDYRATRTTAADIGTLAHARCEAFLRGLEFEEEGHSSELLAASQHSLDRFIEWWNDQGLQVIQCELQMVSDAWNVGGTTDILASRGDKTVLLDLKTSRKGRSGSGIYREMKIQVAGGYRGILTRPHREKREGEWWTCPLRIIDEVWVVRLGKDPDDVIEPYRIPEKEIRGYEDAFERAVSLYYALKRVPA